jgi:hypothetical protein
MSALVLDAGALIAIDKGERAVLAEVGRALRSRQPVRTNAMALAQAWRDGGDDRPRWPGRSATSQWNRSPAKTGCWPENSSAGLACGTRSTLASRCSRDLATGCLPVILATCGGCATRRETRLWWSIADGGDGVPARVRTRGVGAGGDRPIGLGR